MAEVTSAPFHFAGEVVRARFTVNVDEVERRHQFGDLEPPEPEILEALFVLPHAATVDETSLPRWARQALAGVPNWLVEYSTDGLRRCYQPPGTVHELVVADASLPASEQVAALRWLAAVAPCSVLVDASSCFENCVDQVGDTFGSAVLNPDESWVTRIAAPTRRVRSTAQRWLLAERAFASFSRSAAERSSKP